MEVYTDYTQLIRSCKEMKQPRGNRTEETNHAAFVILNSAQNIGNYFNLLWETMQSLVTEMKVKDAYILKSFTYDGMVEAVTAKQIHHEQRTMHWVSTIWNAYMGLAGAVSMAAGPAAPCVMVGVLIEQTAGNMIIEQLFKNHHMGKRDLARSCGATHPNLRMGKRGLVPSWNATHSFYIRSAEQVDPDVASYMADFGIANYDKSINLMTAKELYSWHSLQGTGFQ